MDVGPQVCPGLLAALGVSKGMPQAQSDVSMPGPPRARQGDGQMGSWLIWLSWGPLSAVHGGYWWVCSGQKISAHAHYSDPCSPSIS